MRTAMKLLKRLPNWLVCESESKHEEKTVFPLNENWKSTTRVSGGALKNYDFENLTQHNVPLKKQPEYFEKC